MRIREIGEKAENLIEEGEQVKHQKVYCEQAVTSARGRLAAARAALDEAAETDDEGEPLGDVDTARNQVYAAQAMLDSAERSLAEVMERAEEISRGKRETVREVERYNEGENRNLSQLRELQKKRFGSNTNAFVADLVARMNEGETMRARLLQSMGQGAAARHYTADSVSGEGVPGPGFQADSRRQEQDGAGETRQSVGSQYNAYRAYLEAYREIVSDTEKTPQERVHMLAALDEAYRTIAVREKWITRSTGKSQFLGVRFPDQHHVSEAYKRQMAERFVNAEPSAMTALEAFGGRLSVARDDFDVPGAAAHYNPREGFCVFGQPGEGKVVYEERGVHFNAVQDAVNARGVGTTCFHELGHMIDHAACGYGDSFLSDDAAFREALIEDGKEAEAKFTEAPQGERLQMRKWLYVDHRTHSLSDLLGGLTDERIQGMYGHDQEYWSGSPGAIFHEAFAHFFEASMGQPDKLSIMTYYFPNAYGRFVELLDNAAGETAEPQKKLVLRR